MSWFRGNPTANLEAEAAAAEAVAAHEAGGDAFFSVGNSGATKTLNFANGPVQQVVLSASAPTLTIAGMTAGKYCRMRLLLKQDATGTRLLPTFSPAANYGTPGAPTLTTTVNKTDVLDLFSVDGGTTLKAVVVVKGL